MIYIFVFVICEDGAGSKVIASNTIMSTISRVSDCKYDKVNFCMDAIPFSYRGGCDELLHTHYSDRLARPCLNPYISPKVTQTPNQPFGNQSKSEQGTIYCIYNIIIIKMYK